MMKRKEYSTTSKNLLAAAVMFTVFFMMALSTAGAAVVGRFTVVEGTVDLLKGGNLPALPAKVNLSVEEKDVIRTKSASRAEITMVDKTVLKVAQRSRIDISEYSPDPSKKGVIKLDRGKVEATVEKKPVSRIDVGSKANTFEIHTPNAVAGVRGTRFYMSFVKNVSTTLVRDGNVCVYNINLPQEEVCIPPDYITSVTGAYQPERPKPASKSDVNSFEKEFKGPLGGNGTTQTGGGVDAPPPAVTSVLPDPFDPPPPPVIPVDVDTAPEYPFNVSGYFANEGTPEVPDITGTGTASPKSDGTATISASGAFVPTYMNDTWGATINSADQTGTTPIFEVDLSGTQWSGNTVAASAAGYWIEMSQTIPVTGIFVGETSGTYNPSANTWQATGHGAWIDTDTFLSMTATPTGQAQLASLNIPAVEVGRVDLQGSVAMEGAVSGFDFVSVELNNVIFFAPSTSQNPGLWATNNVTGSYDFSNGSELNATTILSPDNVISLSDDGTITAEFQFTQWQSGKWAGKLSKGSGTLDNGASTLVDPPIYPPGSGYTGAISNMKGGAAGTMTGTAAGTLSGTAAGTVK